MTQDALGVEEVNRLAGHGEASPGTKSLSDLHGAKVDLSFATPIMRCRVGCASKINKPLSELILQDEQQSAGIQRSNVGGWHGKGDIFSKPWPPVASLKCAVVEAVGHFYEMLSRRKFDGDILIEGWSNVSRSGDYNRVHTHCGWSVSGVYYVSSGVRDEARPDSGLLELLDPRPAAENRRQLWLSGPGVELILPSDGLLILFPSWVSHYVNPYTGHVPRISVAFNVALSDG